MNTEQKPICIQSEDIEALVQQGVKRALAAHKRMVALSLENAADISGGYEWNFPIIQGGILGSIDIVQSAAELEPFDSNLQSSLEINSFDFD